MFASKTQGTALIIPIETLASCRKGIKKRITREKNWMRMSDDPNYIRKRRNNIHRLQIIYKELKTLEEQL